MRYVKRVRHVYLTLREVKKTVERNPTFPPRVDWRRDNDSAAITLSERVGVKLKEN